MCDENISTQFFGLLGLLGAIVFALILAFLQLANTGIDWPNHYVSSFANSPYRILLLLAVFVHGLGNFAISAGLYRHLELYPFRNRAVVLFSAAAFSMLIAGIFPIDLPSASRSFIGFVHIAAVVVAFPLELAALVLFSKAFFRNSGWREEGRLSSVLSMLATIGLLVFLTTILANRVPGLGERVAFTGFLLWEIWAASRLMVKPVANGQVETR